MHLSHGGPLLTVTHEHGSFHVLDSAISLRVSDIPAALNKNSDHKLGHMAGFCPGRMNGSDLWPF